MIDVLEIPKWYCIASKQLTRFGNDELVAVRATNRPLVRWGLNVLAKRNIKLVCEVPFDEPKRGLGLDWPATAETMIGMQRLTSLQHCAETVLAEDIPGDLVECGVWRGGACILMRAVLAAYGDEQRNVWVADSFAGVPPPDREKYPADEKSETRSCIPCACGTRIYRKKQLRAVWLAKRSRSLPCWLVQRYTPRCAD